MKSIAFSIQKGGVGKTTTSINTACLLSKEHRVLLIDADPQGSATASIIRKRNKSLRELGSVLSGEYQAATAILEVMQDLYLLPTLSNSRALQIYSEGAALQEPFRFRVLLEEIKKLDIADIVIVDTSPRRGALERGVLAGVDEVIAVLTPDFFSMDGFRIFYDFLGAIEQGYGQKPHFSRLILNKVNRSIKMHIDYASEMKNLDGYTTYLVPQDANIGKAQEQTTPLFEVDEKSRSIRAYEMLAEAIA